MSLISQISLLMYAFFILLFILVYSLRNGYNREKSSRIFLLVIITLMANILFETVTWIIDGIDVPILYHVHYWVNFFLYLFNSLPTAFWLSYIDNKITGDYEKAIKRLRFYFIPFYIMAIALSTNHFTGIVYTIADGNNYVRGMGPYISSVFNFLFLFVFIYLLRTYRKYVVGRLLQVSFFFLLIPLIGTILQIKFYGLSTIWPSFALVIIFTFILIEKDEMLKDVLTGLPDRSIMEQRLNQKIKYKHTFSLVMIDMDKFKHINDSYGHDEGDEALKVVANILRTNVERADLVCRFGGDEFMVLLESEDEHIGVKVVKRIQEKLTDYNRKKIKPYDIQFSSGIKYVDGKKACSLKSIVNEVDIQMYRNKNSNRG